MAADATICSLMLLYSRFLNKASSPTPSSEIQSINTRLCNDEEWVGHSETKRLINCR